jgi:hypothetical protein
VSGNTVSPPESDGGGLVEGGLLIVARMPVEFLSDAEAAAYGRYDGGPSREELDRVSFLDDADRELIEKRRGDHNRLGFALQLTTARWLGVFLPDPTDVPTVVLDYVARQLEIADLSCVGRYLERRPTRFDHAEEIKRACGLREFAQARSEFDGWLWARAWMIGDGPRAIFADAIGWLRAGRAVAGRDDAGTACRAGARGRGRAAMGHARSDPDCGAGTGAGGAVGGFGGVAVL